MKHYTLLLLLFSSVCFSQVVRVPNITTFDHLTISGNDALTLTGDATVWDDLVFPAFQLKTVGQTDKPDFIVANLALSFPEDTTEMVGTLAQMSHRWKPGTRIYPHVHWIQGADQNVDWRISYKWWNIGDPDPVTYTQVLLDSAVIDYTTGTIQQLNTNVTGISGAGKTLSSMIQIKLYRKSDNYTGEVQLLQFDIHFQIDKIGSRTT